MTSLFRRDVLEATWHGSQDEFDHVLLLSFRASPRASLIAMIFAWNLDLTATNAAPLTAFIASFSGPEGLFAGLT